MSVRAGALIVSLVAATACGRIDFDPLSSSDAAAAGDSHVAAAPPSFVQKVEIDGSGSTTASVMFPSNVAAGNLLIAAIDYANPMPDPTSLADTAGDTFTLIEKPTQGTWRTLVGYAIASSGGPMTVTFAVPGSPTILNLRAFEYSNVAPVQPVSASAGATGTSVGPDASTTMISTQEPNELIFAFFTVRGQIAAPGTGFTSRSSFDGDVVEDRVAPTAGSYTVIGSASPAAAEWSLTAVALRGY